MIETLEIHNYKSLRKISLTELPTFAVLVGANAAGKSNFADALDFLSLVFRMGLAGAVRAKGGYENICFRRTRRSKAGLCFRVGARVTGAAGPPVRRRKEELRRFWCLYDFAFKATTEAIGAEYRVTAENLSWQLEGPGRRLEPVLHVRRCPDPAVEQGSAWETIFGGHEVLPIDLLKEWVTARGVPEDELLISAPYWTYLEPLALFAALLRSCRVYQFWPQRARDTGVPGRSPELGRSGEDLPAALDYLKEQDSDAFDELVAHVQHTVPAIIKLETRYVETKQLGLFFKEKGVGRPWFSMDVSDGTIQTVSLFLALVDKRVRTMLVEEPENSLHPWILRHFMEACREKSEEKQILVTTQSPVAVDTVAPESLFLVSRRDGETHIKRCTDLHPETLQVMRENLMGLGEHWESGAIGGVPGDQMALFEDEGST